jgi:hypothetical protein
LNVKKESARSEKKKEESYEDNSFGKEDDELDEEMNF